MLCSYCLDVVPKTFEEYVVWYCDDCKPLDLKLNGIADPRSPPPEGNDSQVLKSLSSTSPEENAKLIQPRGRSKRKSSKMKTRKMKDLKNLNEEKDSSCSTAKTDAQITERSQEPQASCSQNHVNSQSEDKPRPNPEDEKSTFQEAESAKTLSVLPSLDSSETPMDVDYVPAQPIINPIWR